MSIVTTDNKHYSDIAEKIREKAGTDATYKPENMPSGIDDVYKAGQSSMVDESKLIPKTVSGSYISVDDVSEIPHSVGCKVESVNLLNPNALTPVSQYNGIKISYSEEEECFIFNGSAAGVSETSCETRINIPVNIGENITLSTEYVSGTIVQGDGCVFIAAGETPNYGSNWMNAHFNTTSKTATKAAESKYITRVWFYLYNNPVFENYKVKIQLNKGNALPYTPYVKPEEVKVTRCGKNLFDVNSIFPEYVNEYNGISYTNARVNAVSRKRVKVPTKNNITVSADYEITTINASETFVILLVGHDETGTAIRYSDRVRVTGYGKGTIKHTFSNISAFAFTYDTATISASIVLKNLQFELGDKATEYEPYNGQTLTPNIDGTIEGMTSVSPYMNIFTDTEGVNIEATYNKSWGMQTEYDRFWDAYQNYGNRTNYYVAFYSGERGMWNNDNFKPKYPIKPTNANNMLANTAIVGDLTLLADIDFSDATNVPSALAYNPYITRIGVCDLRKTQENGTSLFAYCERLVTVDKVIFKDDGTQHAIASGFAATQCYNLKNIAFEGKANFDVNFKDSPLSKASITSVINTLYEGSTGKTLTLKLSAVNTAFETSSGAGDGSTSAEFAALVATKTNWTITMI